LRVSHPPPEIFKTVAGIDDRVRIILNRILWLIHVFCLESNVILQSEWRFAPRKEASSSEYLEYLSSVWLFYLEYPNPQTNQIVFGLPYSVASTLRPKKKSRKATFPDLGNTHLPRRPIF
jgi:hypothetical protein